MPKSTDDLLVVRPLGGSDDEVTGILTELEDIAPASFDLPDPARIGDYRSSRLLRDAVRLGFRSSAGPFRSFGRIAVEPRPYQLVPLLMALKLDPIRLLIADDVGIGKTIEAGLIAREMIDRGEVSRMAVICPPHLAEQWQTELREKFHIDAALLLPSTAARIERDKSLYESVFDIHPFIVISMEYIKMIQRVPEFVRTCPGLVIVDEAHTCVQIGEERRGGRKQQRFNLISELASDVTRNMIFVTATPHSGNEAAFRSLLSLLRPDFGRLPADLSGQDNARVRADLAQHFVQRRRGDILHYMDTDTPFASREEKDETYKLGDEYKALFARVLRYAREIVRSTTGSDHRRRVRWWSVLALLRSLASSPVAAAATLRARAQTLDATTVSEVDEVGRQTIFDLDPDDLTESSDLTPGADIDEDGESEAAGSSDRRRLLSMATAADALAGDFDTKLIRATALIKGLIKDGYQPIVFCRFVATAEYVAEQLRKRLGKGVEVAAVTGLLPPAEREERVAKLGEFEKHVLVCTDCLSEGINLQRDFDAVVHYDLSWNPTRHEQREGRIDRYGQPKKVVRVLTYYGMDNQIDGIVIDVLLKKHKAIRNTLGISVPVPSDTNLVMEAIFEGLLLRENSGASVGAGQLEMFEDDFAKQKRDLFTEWDKAEEREKRSRTVYAQQTIKVDEVASEMRATRDAIGSHIDIADFVKSAVVACKGAVSANGSVKIDLTEAPRALREAIEDASSFKARFELPVHSSEHYLSRTHPFVEALASYVMDTALDAQGELTVARRCGAMRTRAVERRTTLLLLRLRFHIVTTRPGYNAPPLLAEDCCTIAFEGAGESSTWLAPERAEALFSAMPADNISSEQSSSFVGRALESLPALQARIDAIVRERAAALLDAHQRVRQASRAKNYTTRVEPQLPADILGVYVFLPAVNI
ncbi:MAG TPA: helicase-related protein [Capsulimonadaceae bacterium]|jgi:superfamily II DNA or RNA helicase